MKMFMGYVNAKIGIDNTGHEEVSGTLGLGKMNENGDIFADLCAFNKLIIGEEKRGKEAHQNYV